MDKELRNLIEGAAEVIVPVGMGNAHITKKEAVRVCTELQTFYKAPKIDYSIVEVDSSGRYIFVLKG